MRLLGLDVYLKYVLFFHKSLKSILSSFKNYTKHYQIPFDIDKTILVHLRLDDVIDRHDYDGSICSNHYKNKINNKEDCYVEFFPLMNSQAPLSKEKLDNIINKANKEFPDHKIILITSPGSDTSYLNYDYDVIKSDDIDYDLYLLTICKVTILSRSLFAYSSLYFNKDKTKTYLPLWGHIVCCGLDTIYDKNDKSIIEYFY